MSKLIADEALRERLINEIERELWIFRGWTTKQYAVENLESQVDSLVKLFTAAQRQLLAELLGELPKKSTLETVEEESQEYADGKDDAIDEVVSVIEHYLTKAEP